LATPLLRTPVQLALDRRPKKCRRLRIH